MSNTYDLAFYVVAILDINLETKLPLQYILFTLVSTLQVIVLCRHAVVAMYVFMCVCMYICMYVRTYVHTCVCMYVAKLIDDY